MKQTWAKNARVNKNSNRSQEPESSSSAERSGRDVATRSKSVNKATICAGKDPKEMKTKTVELLADGMRLTVDADEENEFLQDNQSDEEDDGDLEKEDSDNEASETEPGELESDDEDIHFRTPINADEHCERPNEESTNDAKSEQQALKILADNPHLNNVFMKLIKKGIREEIDDKQSISEGKRKTNNSANKGKLQTTTQQIQGKEPSSDSQMRKTTAVPKTPINRGRATVVKSPSDTTIYAPALKRHDPDVEKSGDIMERISNFIEEIRFDTVDHVSSPNKSDHITESDMEQQVDPPQPSTSTGKNVNIEAARERIINSEKFNASVEPPPKGRSNFFDKIQCDHDKQDDDEYFHLACHVDNALKQKIERGEYVELDKLVPRRKSFAAEDGCLEWVTKDRLTFLAPAQDKDQKITNYKKWDQAFRVYTSIYCNVKPSRLGEIWQYIHTISSAATSFQWDNVAYYDTVFRQMMADRPGRSWSKLYVQLWQLALRDPIQKQTGSNFSASQGFSSGKKSKNWRDNCCWRFNKIGKCDRKNCEFDNRCSYCGMWYSHGAYNCRKKANEKGPQSHKSAAPSSK